MQMVTFRTGDRLVHADRPEWGVGEVTAVEPVFQNGQRSQRLRVRFERVGVKTLASGLAALRPAQAQPALDRALAETAPGLDPSATARVTAETLTTLPEPCTDPFRSPMGRLEALLGLYRFSSDGASLMDWAAMQTGLADPLSRFTRHELEEHFKRFASERDQRLRRTWVEARAADPSKAADLLSRAPRPATDLVKRIDSGR